MKTNSSARRIWKTKIAGIGFLFLSLVVVNCKLGQSLAETMRAKTAPAQSALQSQAPSVGLGDVFSGALH